MKKLIIFFGSLLLILIAMACQEDQMAILSNSEDDQSVVTELATSEEEVLLFDALVDDGSEENMYDGYSSFGSGIGKVTAPINSVWRFGRKFDPFPRRVVRDVRFVTRDSAVVTVNRLFTGKFVVISKEEDSTGTNVISIYRKPMKHLHQRRAIYVTRASSESDGRWKLEAVSLGLGESRPESTIEILEAHISSNMGLDYTITDPLNIYLGSRAEIPKVVPGEEITVVIKVLNHTTNPVILDNGTTETVLLHFGRNRNHHARKRFHFVGQDPVTGANMYKGTWTVGQVADRFYHAAFDVIDNGTIYDDDSTTYPYNSLVWALPYHVVSSK